MTRYGARLAEIETAWLERNAKKANIARFLQTLARQGDDLVPWSGERLWHITAGFHNGACRWAVDDGFPRRLHGNNRGGNMKGGKYERRHR